MRGHAARQQEGVASLPGGPHWGNGDAPSPEPSARDLHEIPEDCAMKSIDPTISATVSAIWRHRFLAILILLVTFCAAVAAYLATPPTFESSASLLIRQDNPADAGNGFMPTEVMSSQARIAESDDVVRAAIETIGIDKLTQPTPGPLSGLSYQLRALVREWRGVSGADAWTPETVLSPLDRAVNHIRSAMRVRVEPNSSVLTISVRDGSPVLSADMANALAESFIDRQNSLLKRPGLVEFLEIQTRRFDEEATERSVAMQNFMNDQRAHSIEEQRTLLLKRQSDLDTAIAETRGRLADKEGQKQSLARQLALLEPVARSPFTLGFVQRLDENRDGVGLDGASPLPPLTKDSSPLSLLINVFQDAMAAYLIIDVEIGGLRDLADQQSGESASINDELSRVTAVQGEYERLKRQMDITAFNADTFARRTIEEQIEADLRDAKLSSVRVIQPAARPISAVSPKGVLYAGFGVALGLVLGIAAALAKEMYDLNRRSAWRN